MTDISRAGSFFIILLKMIWLTMAFSRLLASSCLMALFAQPVVAQVSAEDLRKQIDSRSNSLSGFQELLEDPDPRRALAAVELMLASGDANVERMALEFGLTNPDPTIRATALAFHLAKLPAIAVSLDATTVPEEQMKALGYVLKDLGGSIGPDKKGSFSFQAAAYSDKLGCYPMASDAERCAMRISAGALSLHFTSRNVEGSWANLHADESGNLTGGVSLSYANYPPVSISLSARLLN